MVDTTPATIFWSYAHADDDGSKGRIRRLSERLSDYYRMHSGEPIARFFDRDGQDGLKWGVEWRSKISTSIFGTTFFVPVISPSYLKSPNCREEFMQFWKRAEHSDVPGLMLPILWLPAFPTTPEEKAVWEVVQNIQFVDWTSTRREDEQSIEYEALIDRMAARLFEVAREVAEKPEVDPNALAAETSSQSEDTSYTIEDVLEAWENAERLMAEFVPQLSVAAEKLGDTMRVASSMDQLHPNSSSGQRLFYFNAMASRMLQPAKEFEQTAKTAESTTRSITTAISTFHDFVTHPMFEGKLPNFNVAGLDQLRDAPAALSARFGNYADSREQLSQLGRMSRGLREPMSALDRGFDSLDAIGEMAASWADLIDDVRAVAND